MKIAFVCVTHKPINLSSTGGIETFSLYLVNSLQSAGHSVTVFAAEETERSVFKDIDFHSVFSIKDIEKTANENLESKSFALNYSLFQYSGMRISLDLKDQFDIIHFSSAQWYVPFILNSSNFPVVSTVHVNNLRPAALNYVLKNFSNSYIANISDAASAPFKDYQKRKTLYNGVDMNQFSFLEKSEEYFAWLGRIAPVKGLKEACQAAKIADVELVASGPIDFVDYFNNEVKPNLFSKTKIIPPLRSEAKIEFLQKAKATLMPVQWEEPFGLVAIESMACGTPVIAFAKGGLKELIIDGVTGFLVNSVEEMAKKMQLIDQIDRKKCREHVEKNFSAQVMANNYLDYYKQIIDGEYEK